MPGTIAFPTIVEQAVEEFGGLFANEPQRKHFGEYLTGLLIAERKSVNGINSEFAQTTDQSCLNRWMSEIDWSGEDLNQMRLAWTQKQPDMRYSQQGVIPIDNVLVEHSGKLIVDAGLYWDHADKRHMIAQDYLIANYVCTSGKHFALDFRRFRKAEDCELARTYLEEQPGGFAAANSHDQAIATFKTHTQLCNELVDEVVAQNIPGSFAFDSYFTCADILNHINELDRVYVGDLKANRKVIFKGQEMSMSGLAHSIPPDSRKPVEMGGRKQWYLTVSIRIPDVNHKVRVAILWRNKSDPEPAKILITNRVIWEITRILGVYRNRWTGTETLHRDGKQELGMGECQLRSGEGQTRHMYLVLLAHTLLMAQLRQGRSSHWAHATLNTIGEACRAALRESLGKTIDWAISKATDDGWKPDRIKTHLALI